MKCNDCGAANVPLRQNTWNLMTISRCDRCWKAWAGQYAPHELAKSDII